ncbi:helix-turn-helix domain-containing protein [Treponema sp.]|uniref:helix-turn-helix domain-containing protein n=1 Tax=Treponema sp. TaxID=166 RepID=UPI0038910144
MMIHAYPESYLSDAQQNFGTMFDFALRVLNYDEDKFFIYFIQSDIARKFEHANPKYIAGMSGIELCENVLKKIDSPSERLNFTLPENFKTEYGVEFWTGWILAYYQWYSALKFSDLLEYGLTPSEVSSRYILHEADVSKFVETADKIILSNKNNTPTRLQKIRKQQNMTQDELSKLSGVSLRMIQLYEQRQNNINKASGETINALARALCCNFYDIMEINLDE